MCDIRKIAKTRPFTFLLGEEKAPVTIHAALVEEVSAPLYALMTNGSMKESQAGVATLEDVDVETFLGFCEYMYTDDYLVPGAPSKRQGRQHDALTRPASRTWSEADDEMEYESRTVAHYGVFTDHIHDRGREERERNLESERFFTGRKRNFNSRRYTAQVGVLSSEPHILFHAKLYVFATTYLIEPLRQKCLASLHRELCVNVGSDHSDLVLELVDYVYSNTARREPTGKSLIRDLVMEYVVCRLPALSKQDGFVELLDSHAEIGSDLAMKLVE